MQVRNYLNQRFWCFPNQQLLSIRDPYIPPSVFLYGILQSAGWNPVEGELDFRPCHLSADLEHWIGQEVDWSGGGTWFDHEVAAAAEFDAVGRMMAKVISRQGGTLVALADVSGPPLPVGVKLHPAMISINSALVSLRRNGRSDGEARGDADGP